MRHFRPLLRWLHLALICITLLSYLAPYISPKDFWPFALLGLSYPILLIANLLFLGAWLLLKDRYVFFAMATIFLGWSHLTTLFGFGSGYADAKEQLKVLSFNSYGFRNWETGGTWVSQETIKTLFSEQAPDIICLQEYPKGNNSNKRARRALKELGYTHECWQTNGTLAIFSRFPIKKSENHYFKNGSNGFQWADIALPNQDIRVFNLHLQSNSITGVAAKVMDEGNLQERSTWRNIRRMISNYRRAAIRRSTQAETVNKVIAESPNPVVLSGDLNEAPNSYVYQVLTQRLNDAFQEAGRGLGVTYAGKLPGLRIDYILTDPRIQVADYHIFNSDFSDHKGVTAILNLPTGN